MPGRHSPGLHAAGRRRDRRWVAAGGVLVLVGIVAVLLSRPSGTPERAGATARASTGPVSADPGPEDLLAWTARELPAGARLRAAPEVRADLLRAGAPEELLDVAAPPGPDDVVLEITTDGQPPAGRVLARVGGLVVVDPTPGVPTPEQLDHRNALAQALLANPTAQVGADAVPVLEAAEVDTRLLALLAALGAQRGVGVAAFPGVSGTDGLPARWALVESVGGAPVGAGEAATDALLTWLEAQRPPFGPDEVRVTGDGVVVGHRYVSDPDGAVAAPGS